MMGEGDFSKISYDVDYDAVEETITVNLVSLSEFIFIEDPSNIGDWKLY